MSSDPAIITEGLSKKYPGTKVHALKDLDIKIMPGEVYGFLGPNGAGKSTTIRTLMNFIQPTSGAARICGLDIVEDSVNIKSKVGYLAGSLALYSKMTGRQFLSYMAELQPPKHAGNVDVLAKRFNASLNKKISDLSKGNQQKIGIIQAFMHQPEVLILDEPTSGLDPLMQEQFYELVKEAKGQGAAVFVSSHNLTEVQKMCDRVGFIREGRLISEQTLADLAKEATQTFDIGFASEVPLAQLKKIPKVKVVKNSHHHATVHMHGNLSSLFAVLAKHEVSSINQREASLEQEFMQFYEGAKK
jgi:ABC-2 type transport system ATP-binding protein